MTACVIDDYLEVLTAFDVDPSSCRRESICPFGPVFLVQDEDRELVIKRTRSPLPRALALHRWAASLRFDGVPVVTPDVAVQPNPVTVGGDVWVVYPFVEGQPYSGSNTEILAAGELLGAIHAAETSGVGYQDFVSFEWAEDQRESWAADLESLAQLVVDREIPQADDLLSRYQYRLGALHAELVPMLRSADLVWRCGPWDFKANNLVYQDSSRPVLVDPDSAGYLPRILDLALAAVLFHNEAPQAPARLLDEREWNLFLSGYAKQVRLTSEERDVWPLALELMHLEEGLWLILNDSDGWEHPRQRCFLSDLLVSDLRHLKRI
jgi:Ser/Thr protein kinase RdoA (MazF antagonist)